MKPTREEFHATIEAYGKEKFEVELAKVIEKRLADHYGPVYKIQETSENVFLLCLAVVSFTAFACVAFLWAFLP